MNSDVGPTLVVDIETQVTEESSNVGSMEAGSLGVLHLKRLWSRLAMNKGQGSRKSQAGEWVLDKIVLRGLGLALEETLQYLGRQAPTYEEFEKWILGKNGRIESDQIERINAIIAGRDYSEQLKEKDPTDRR